MVAIITALTACVGSTGTNGDKTSNPANSKAVEKKVDYPKKPLTLIVPFPAGGGGDTVGRALAKSVEKHLGQSIVVVNKTGGGGSVGMTEGANAKGDGYTLTLTTLELTVMSHLGFAPLTFESFKPVALISYDGAAITVHANSQWKTAQDFLDYAKNHPGQLKLGNSGTGASWHLAAAAVEKAAGVKFTHIPFEGSAPAVTALLGGHVDAVFVSAPEVRAHVEAGKLRTLAILDDKPSTALPNVKTIKEETGLQFNYIGTWRGINVPKDTPDEIVSVLEDAFMKAAEDQEFKDLMNKNGIGILVKDSKSFGQFLKEKHELFGRLIPEIGLSKK
jgi:tripartite-type tricarboxylate transporter receptor subunit TctC